MTGREPVRIELLARSARLSGPGVLAACEATGVPTMRDPRNRGARLVPITYLDDVLAHLEHVQRRPLQMIDTAAGVAG